MDITSSIQHILLMFVSGAHDVYSTLERITFFGTSLLDYSITLLLLSVVIPMVITLVRSGRFTVVRSYRERSRERKEGSSE